MSKKGKGELSEVAIIVVESGPHGTTTVQVLPDGIGIGDGVVGGIVDESGTVVEVGDVGSGVGGIFVGDVGDHRSVVGGIVIELGDVGVSRCDDGGIVIEVDVGVSKGVVGGSQLLRGEEPW